MPWARSLREPPFPERPRSVTVSFPTSMTFSLSGPWLFPGCCLVLHEQAADRIAVMDALDRLAEQPADALDAHLAARGTELAERDRVGDDHVLERRVLDPGHRPVSYTHLTLPTSDLV